MLTFLFIFVDVIDVVTGIGGIEDLQVKGIKKKRCCKSI